MDLYRTLLKRLLFRLPAERASNLSKLALGAPLASHLVSSPAVSDARLSTNLGGLEIGNPVGLAPGFDKDCDLIDPMQAVGFGYLVVGSICLQPRPGNPHPRLIRDVPNESIVVSLGLPSKGLDHSMRNLGRSLKNRQIPLVASVAGFSQDEVCRLHESVEPLVDGVELSFACPNVNYDSSFVQEVKSGVRQIAGTRKKPLFLKVPFYSDSKGRDTTLEMVDSCVKNGVHGVSIVGAKPVSDSRMGIGRGGVSGRLAYGDTLRIVRDIYAEAGDKIAIKASGGISTGEDAFGIIKHGATSIEIYSSLVFEGLGVVRRINLRLLDLISKQGYKSVEEARGSSPGKDEDVRHRLPLALEAPA